MPTDVVMPQMGESIAEGTIVRWIKKVGDSVDKDEPLFEISTDKVDAEIPSPGAGVVLDIKVQEGETVPVNSVVAVIGEAGAATAPVASGAGAAVARDFSPASGAGAAGAPGAATVARDSSPASVADATGVPDGARDAAPDGARDAAPDVARDFSPASVTAAPGEPGAPSALAAPGAAPTAGREPETVDDLRRQKSSPVVRKIAHEHGIDITQLDGTGISGRVTKRDILAFIEGGGQTGAAAAARADAGLKSRATGAPAAPVAPSDAELKARAAGAPPAAPAFQPGESVRVEKMGVMRKKIAEHMVMSVHTSPHVYSAYEVDFGRIDEIRKKKRAEYEAAGAKLTYTAFIAKATVDTIRRFPFSNASIDGDSIVYKRDINLGIAVALDQGLIVPVIRNADERNMLGLCRAIQDLAHRARTKQLKPEDVQGGTFTITNPGIFGAVFGLPIISQPQVAILGVGSIDRRVVVVDDDKMVIRPMCWLTLGFDHRLIDGADAGRFLLALKERLQAFEESWL